MPEMADTTHGNDGPSAGTGYRQLLDVWVSFGIRVCWSQALKGLVPGRYQQSTQPMADRGRAPPCIHHFFFFLVAAVASRLEPHLEILSWRRSPSRDHCAPGSFRFFDSGPCGWSVERLLFVAWTICETDFDAI